jgi:hypothetical protein
MAPNFLLAGRLAKVGTLGLAGLQCAKKRAGWLAACQKMGLAGLQSWHTGAGRLAVCQKMGWQACNAPKSWAGWLAKQLHQGGRLACSLRLAGMLGRFSRSFTCSAAGSSALPLLCFHLADGAQL